MHNLQIEQTPINSLRQQRQNARTHSKRQIRQIADSIQRFGFCNAILVDDDLTILAGHGRVGAAQLLKLTHVPTARLSHLSEADKRAYVIADNRLAEKAGWDRSLLAIELQSLIDIGFEVELTGFETPEIDLLLDEALEAAGLTPAADDHVPEQSNGPPTSRLGDFWVMGPHRLLCGDARDPACYARLFEGKKADLMCTDPPYNVPIDGHVSGNGRVRHSEFAMASGEMSEPEFIQFLSTTLGLAVKFSRDGALTTSSWTGGTCSNCSPQGARSMTTTSTYASGTRTMAAWDRFTDPSTNSFLYSKSAPRLTSTMLNLAGMGATEPMFGIMLA